ncbi:glycosyltransferase [Aureibaculum marinum]|uniref:Glycosyltransferase n=1 Tax=Aureibaculum marinum TaxID=2487930 RepID=A0A3N4NJV0_9FLAO|nr:glycosyltransferase [Aureibaculum marinum]RPD96481.1 glycosyltransferase [Aureibaculum marinum]
MNKSLHIISFDVPYPPNYGGIIDVFYKLKSLYELKIDIYLHTFEFGKGKQDELKKYCKQVYYYKRKPFINSIFSTLPLRVNSRQNERLSENLNCIEAPILFEGLHTTSLLLKTSFSNRKLLVRAHNIEHNYFYGLAKSEKNILKKIIFKIEAFKLQRYEKILDKVNSILTISPLEQSYFKQKFGDKAFYLPAFHKNNTIKNLSEKGSIILYHGDLRVADNIKAVLYLIDILKEINFPTVFASSFKNEFLSKKISSYSNMQFVIIKDKNHLDDLLKKAHINILPTFQNTGIKLKLINVLFNGRFCLVNSKMVENTGLENLCEIANTKKEFTQKIIELLEKNYTTKNFENRLNSIHLKEFDTKKNAQKIIDLAY